MDLRPIKIFGIIGNPIEHSLSPFMHNAAFAKLGIKAVYLPFYVEKDRLKETISYLKRDDISGFNVTIPFKSECMRYLDRIEPTARMIGAVNTAVVRNKRLIGYNTDYAGFLKSLREDLGFKPKGKDIFIIGAGGAARAVAFGLAKEGARRICIFDIIARKAKGLAGNIRRYFRRCGACACSKIDIPACLKGSHLLVNCAPLGMKEADPLPVEARLLHKGLRLYDIVYTPLETRLVKEAKKRGIRAAGGLGMLLYQGAISFRLWTGRRPPVSLMRRQLIKHLR